MLGNKPSYSTMSLDIFTYVNHNIDIGTQYMDTGFLANIKGRCFEQCFIVFAAFAEG